MDSLRIKTDASARTRPSICNIHFLLLRITLRKHVLIQHEATALSLHPRFQRIVDMRMQAGSRKLRADLLTEIIGRHNRSTVGKSRISPDEIQAVQLQFGWTSKAHVLVPHLESTVTVGHCL